MSWLKIDCARSDALHRDRDMDIHVGFTDMDGEFGTPEIRRDWGDKATGQLVVRDLWFPETSNCEHWEFQEDGW